MPSGGSVEGSVAVSDDGSVVSAIGAEVSTMISGLFDIETSVQDKSSNGNKYFIFPPKWCTRGESNPCPH